MWALKMRRNYFCSQCVQWRLLSTVPRLPETAFDPCLEVRHNTICHTVVLQPYDPLRANNPLLWWLSKVSDLSWKDVLWDVKHSLPAITWGMWPWKTFTVLALGSLPSRSPFLDAINISSCPELALPTLAVFGSQIGKSYATSTGSLSQSLDSSVHYFLLLSFT